MTEMNETLETGPVESTETLKKENVEGAAAASARLLGELKQALVRPVRERPSINIIIDDEGNYIMSTTDCFGVRGLITSRFVTELWNKVDSLRDEFLKATDEQKQG